MKKLFPITLLLTASIMGIVDIAQAQGIPLFNATCPGKIEVHADKGGPVYINGKKATLKKVSNKFYEAKGSGVTISIMINEDESLGVSYTGPGRANGICTVKED
jgi:hypothetical protein